MSETFRRQKYDIPHCLKISHTTGYTDTGIKQYHYDPDPIIDYFKNASGNIIIQGIIYKIHKGDIVILSPKELHLCQLEEDAKSERISIHVNKNILKGFDCDTDEFFEVFFRSRKEHGNIIPCDIARKAGIDVAIEKLIEHTKSENQNRNVLIKCKTIELISLIESAADKYKPKAETRTENERLQEILYYINHHYTENITLTDISERFFYSKFHICMLFRENIGISLTDYVTIRRIHYINDLIIEGVPIAQASVMGGFHNYSNFYRLYKKHMKITPLEYKKQMSEN